MVSSANCGISARGISCGSSVPRWANVAAKARLKSTPSKSKFSQSSHTSKKSFIRLLVAPSETIASNFSATTVSRGYKRKRGGGNDSNAGYSPI